MVKELASDTTLVDLCLDGFSSLRAWCTVLRALLLSIIPTNNLQ
jgi:hypothetical protein